jgi:hypothetical protein
MQFIDVLSFCFSVLGLYGLVFYLRFLIPRNVLPYVSAVLTEAEHLLYEAVMPLLTDRHLTDQHSCASEF